MSRDLTTKTLLTVLIALAASYSAPVTTLFQNGTDGYTGTSDRELRYMDTPFSDTGIIVEEN